MSAAIDPWNVPAELQPQDQDFPFDIDWSVSSTVTLRAVIPHDASTVQHMGSERIGHGVLIDDEGHVLTIGYLVTEAEEVWLTTHDGRSVPAHVLGSDSASGLGLLKALQPLAIPPIALGDSRHVSDGDQVIVAGGGLRDRSVTAGIVARQEFAGYWEYVLDEAIFTAPGHPLWSGAALIGPTGRLLGICSLQLQQRTSRGRIVPLNMVVPIELLPPILEDLKAGASSNPARPWLGVFAQDDDDHVVITGSSSNGPAQRAGVRPGDIVRAVAGREVSSLAGFYRSVWALGPAGVEVPLTLEREGDVFDVSLRSRDRRRELRQPRMH